MHTPMHGCGASTPPHSGQRQTITLSASDNESSAPLRDAAPNRRSTEARTAGAPHMRPATRHGPAPWPPAPQPRSRTPGSDLGVPPRPPSARRTRRRPPARASAHSRCPHSSRTPSSPHTRRTSRSRGERAAPHSQYRFGASLRPPTRRPGQPTWAAVAVGRSLGRTARHEHEGSARRTHSRRRPRASDCSSRRGPRIVVTQHAAVGTTSHDPGRERCLLGPSDSVPQQTR